MTMAPFIDAIFATYAVLCLAHLGLQVILAHAHYLGWRNVRRPARQSVIPRISIIYPIYNETPEVLARVLRCAISCLSLPGLELIFVDDGSPNRAELEPIYDRFRGERVQILFQENRGKRAAQYAALAVAKGDVIVTVDSDTLIDPRGVRRLVAPFDDPEIGAVCGDVVVENRGANLLTRLIGLRYWTAFNLERAAQSFVKNVLCCSGPFSAYRGGLLQRVKEKYVSQTFCGRRCTYGDDRHLTNLVLAESYKVVYEPCAVGSQRLLDLGMPCVDYVDRNDQATARSLHRGGAHVLMLDGAARFVRDEVDRGLWHVMHSRETPAAVLEDFSAELERQMRRNTCFDAPSPQPSADVRGGGRPRRSATLTNSLGMRFANVPSGMFTMGIPDVGNDAPAPPECFIVSGV